QLHFHSTPSKSCLHHQRVVFFIKELSTPSKSCLLYQRAIFFFFLFLFFCFVCSCYPFKLWIAKYFS
ncbi:unnamed protein product, partial [Prunus brigantina]